jgi:DNA-binding GntR family transcriptional regulator
MTMEKEEMTGASTLFNKTSRSQEAADYIRRSILENRWDQGDQIDDKSLSEELGLSRNSVREALAKLISLGIVERRHWKGYFVVRLDQDDTEAILDVRRMLETTAFEGFLKRITPELIGELEEAVQTSEEDLRLERIGQFHRSDYQFHEIIHEHCGNQWIIKLINQVRFFWDLLRVQDKKGVFKASAEKSVEEHRKLIELLKREDYKEARKYMENHLAGHRRRVHEARGR